MSFADEPTSVKASDAVTLVADASPAEKPAEAKDEPPPPIPNKGDTAWMIVATALVTLMVIPGLALFYGDVRPYGQGAGDRSAQCDGDCWRPCDRL